MKRNNQLEVTLVKKILQRNFNLILKNKINLFKRNKIMKIYLTKF